VSSRLPVPGDLIDGRYRVQRALGAGSMGTVYEASHHVTGKRFALKWLFPELTKVHGVVERFIREAQLGAQLEHPNLVEVYDMGQAAESLYIVMELLEGEPLSERLTRVQRLTPRAACELLCPCMEAVALAHRAGVIHRDLKPANIFVCKSNASVPEHARVLDFGVSKLAGGSQLERRHWARTIPGMVLGTPYYMSPEQMRGEDVDARADVYSFGVIMYEVLSGEQPFPGESFADLLAQVLTETPRSLDCVAELPEGLGGIVAQAMAREPTDRFASMEALLEALAPIRAGRSERRRAVHDPADRPAVKLSHGSETESPRRREVPAGRMPVRQPVERTKVPRPPRNSNAGSIAAFVAALAFVVAGTWATGRTPAEQARQAGEAALEDSELANQEPAEPALEPKASRTARVLEIDAVADAREVAKAARAAREPERVAIPRRRTTPTSPAEDKSSAVRANPRPDTLQERPITLQRLSNGLIDPFDAH
jgi:serine/threonine protein kinase